jgi:hypothetical protein
VHTVLLLIQLTALPDSARLRTVADSFGVPHAVAEAIAWMETRSNVNPLVRGPGVLDSTWVGDTLRVYRKCREVGRFQLRPCIDWVSRLNDWKCSTKLISNSYRHNIHCGIKHLRLLYDTRCNRSWVCVMKRQNGAGPRAEKYLHDALSYVGRRQINGID